MQSDQFFSESLGCGNSSAGVVVVIGVACGCGNSSAGVGVNRIDVRL